MSTARRHCPLTIESLTGLSRATQSRMTAEAIDAAIAASLRTPPRPERRVRVPRRAKPPPVHIYFVEAIGLGLYKIGYAANVRARLSTLSVASPVPLRIAATHPGSPEDERRYHERFAADRMRGEWFRASPALIAHIEQLARPA